MSASSSSAAEPAEPHDAEHPADDCWEASRPRVELARWRQVRLKPYAVRFGLGAAASLLATVAGQLVTHRFGGVFTAFPAILLASLTLLGRKEGSEPSAEDAEGGVLGAIAFCLCAILLAGILTLLVGAVALLLALATWSLIAIGLYLLCVKLGRLRTTPEDQAAEDQAAEDRAAAQASHEP